LGCTCSWNLRYLPSGFSCREAAVLERQNEHSHCGSFWFVCIRGHAYNTDQYVGLSLLHIREYSPCVEPMPSGFKTMPNTYSLDLAPSARARCKRCKTSIGKGEVRVVTHAFVRPNRGTYFVRHALCATPGFMTAVLKTHCSIEHVPVNGSMDEDTILATRAILHKLCAC
jgi:hypothetical protein